VAIAVKESNSINSAYNCTKQDPEPHQNLTTAHFFWPLHEKNLEHRTSIRGLVNYYYNQLLKQQGLQEEIPGGEDYDYLGMDKTTSIIHPDLYYQAYQKVLSDFNDHSMMNVCLSTANFFNILHNENIKHSANLRGMINLRYNQLLNNLTEAIPGETNLEVLGLDQTTNISHPDLYFKAYEEVLSLFNTKKKIKDFWENEIANRYIYHGSHIIYRNHIEKYGFNSNKPLERITQRMINFYNRNCRKANLSGGVGLYFDQFIQRYQSNQTAVSFTMKTSTANEFSVGARSGGEWIYVLRKFTSNLEYEDVRGTITLNHEDREDLKYCRELISIIDSLASMRIKVKCSCSDFDNHPALFLGSFESFQNKIIKRFHPSELSNIETVFTTIREGWTNPAYETTISLPIGSKNIEFEVDVGENPEEALNQLENGSPSEKQTEEDLKKQGIPILHFDERQKLSIRDVVKLKILAQTNTSELDFYKDSIFAYERAEPGFSFITRKKCSEHNFSFVKEQNSLRMQILKEIVNH